MIGAADPRSWSPPLNETAGKCGPYITTEFPPQAFVRAVTIAANHLLPAGRLPIVPGVQPQASLH